MYIDFIFHSFLQNILKRRTSHERRWWSGGISDDKESIISTLKSRNSCLHPVGHERKKKKGPQTQGQSSFLSTEFVLVYKNILVHEDNLCLQTSASTVDEAKIIDFEYLIFKIIWRWKSNCPSPAQLRPSQRNKACCWPVSFTLAWPDAVRSTSRATAMCIFSFTHAHFTSSFNQTKDLAMPATPGDIVI